MATRLARTLKLPIQRALMRTTMSASTSLIPDNISPNAEAGPSSPRSASPTPSESKQELIDPELVNSTSIERSKTAAEKWYNPLGPPPGSQFGARFLKDDQDVFDHNAWDHVELPEDFLEKAKEKLELHMSNPVAADKRDDYNARPAHYWDRFYSTHQDMFFKDRAWLRLEFPELIACSEADAGPRTVLEVGCGAGNTVFPLLMHNENPQLRVWATDYSAKAVDVVKANPMYPKPQHGKGILHAAVWDITSKPGVASTAQSTSNPSSSPSSSDPTEPPIERTESAGPVEGAITRSSRPTFSLPAGLEPNSVDVLTVIYVLSALHPSEWRQAMHNLYSALKPNGLLLIRDYARHDLAQLRIKRDRLLDPATPNLYIRGDGTRVYFFEKEELGAMLTAGVWDGSTDTDRPWPSENRANGREGGEGMFAIEQLAEDRRLLVNRKEKLKMYRIWLQAKARKLPPGEGSEAQEADRVS